MSRAVGYSGTVYYGRAVRYHMILYHGHRSGNRHPLGVTLNYRLQVNCTVAIQLTQRLKNYLKLKSDFGCSPYSAVSRDPGFLSTYNL